MKTKTVIYSWPQSQDCAECDHGEFLISLDNSSYICGCNYKKPLDGICPMQKPREEDNGSQDNTKCNSNT